ncbi:MMPL family transporter [Arthrobacter sp. H14]|uniref:MMPL family transporter n=1 Tax=Arthrobacter sp. H14 TaxID=1312959 RepID=UPI0004AFBB90|nr:MMPL family transporter [Arthrobacter sp. H14]
MRPHHQTSENREVPGKTSRWLRIFLPAVVIIIWLLAAGFGGPTFGKLSSVASNDQASFLPSDAESTRVSQWQSKFRDAEAIPAVVVIESEDGVSRAELPRYAEIGGELAAVEGILGPDDGGGVAGPIPSKDGQAVQYIVPVAESADVEVVITELTSVLDESVPSGASAYVTGPAGLTADLVAAFAGIDGILLAVALAAVFIILLIVYRAVLLPFLVLFSAVFALCASILLVYYFADWGWISLSGQSQGILSILVIGAATDYSLLLVARYREALLDYSSRWEAIWKALKAAFAPILASGLTVIIALLCLLFSELKSNQSLGPIAAIGIVFSLLSALTFLPALLVLFGRAAFWPFRPKVAEGDSETAALDLRGHQNGQPDRQVSAKALGLEGSKGLWKRVGSLVAARPRVTWISTLVLLLAAAAGVLQLQASGVPQSELILTKSDAVAGQEVQAEHFDAGAGSPAVIVASEGQAQQVLAEVEQTDNIAAASYVTGQQGRPAAGQEGSPGAGQEGPPDARQEGQPGAGPVEPEPLIRDGRVLINATLGVSVESEAAEDVVTELRQTLPDSDPGALVGGTTAIAVDTNEAAQEDLYTIIPLVLGVILVILMLLLRSVLAPVLLIASVVLSYASAMGVSALVFNHVFGFDSADASVPLFGFVFLVALGVDYNIFLMTRVREEAAVLGTRAGILRGLVKTGSVITSAGIVLAATFAALGVIPILFLVQIAFIVSFGVLLDTVIVRSLLVPALAYDIGPAVWWPGRLWRSEKHPEAAHGRHRKSSASLTTGAELQR